MTRIVPTSWMPKVPMKRVIVHWTAGTYTPNEVDKRAYHILIDGDGKLVRGTPSIDKNSGTLKTGYAAHTLNCNSDSIGVSIACMAGAVEVPFNAGKYPMLERQFKVLSLVLADLCETYNIPVSLKTTLSHAEVQANLGITQRNKWDYTRLPYALEVRGARVIGDMLRSDVSAHLKKGTTPVEPIPAGGVAETIAKTDFYSSPTGHISGSLNPGVRVTVVGNNDTWVRVISPAGYEGWIKANTIKMIDGPRPLEPTTPNPLRQYVQQMRQLLDELEKKIEEQS